MNETPVVPRPLDESPQRPRRRGKSARRPARSRWRGGAGRLDALLVVLLALPLCASLLYLAATPPTRQAFAIDAAPDNAIFRNFYGTERNANGAFRWTKPEASFTVPVAAPATYALTLTVQDSASAPPGRQTTVYLNGQQVGRVTLTSAPQATRFVPPGDPRSLGALVTAIQIEPVAGDSAAGGVLARLENRQPGTLSFRNLRLWQVPSSAATASGR